MCGQCKGQMRWDPVTKTMGCYVCKMVLKDSWNNKKINQEVKNE